MADDWVQYFTVSPQKIGYFDSIYRVSIPYSISMNVRLMSSHPNPLHPRTRRSPAPANRGSHPRTGLREKTSSMLDHLRSCRLDKFRRLGLGAGRERSIENQAAGVAEIGPTDASKAAPGAEEVTILVIVVSQPGLCLCLNPIEHGRLLSQFDCLARSLLYSKFELDTGLAVRSSNRRLR